MNLWTESNYVGERNSTFPILQAASPHLIPWGALWKVSGRKSTHPLDGTKHRSVMTLCSLVIFYSLKLLLGTYIIIQLLKQLPDLLIFYSLYHFSDILVSYEIKTKKCRAHSFKLTLDLPSPQPKNFFGEGTIDLHRTVGKCF